MPDNILEISYLCPLKFKKVNFANPAPYNTKYHDDWHFAETLPYYARSDNYKQPWQKNDIIYLQILTNYGPHVLQMFDVYGIKRADVIFDYMPTSIEGTGLKVYQAAIAVNTLAEGDYRFVLKSGDPLIDTYETDWICLLELHKGSFLFQYRHDENDFNTVFETGYHPRLRVHGGFSDFTPQSESVVFIDQPNNATLLSSRTFTTEKVVIGNSYGVPRWMIERINDIFSCSEILIDGKQWTKVSGAKWEANRIEGHYREGWTYEVRPTKNRRYNRFVNDGAAGSSEYYVTYNIEGNLFGDFTGPASSNVIQIQSNNE
jgi:hypothetical protein